MFLEFFLFILKTVLGYIYPIWASLLLIGSKNNQCVMNSEDSVKWLSYWVIVSILHVVLFPFLDIVVEWNPEYFQAIGLLLKTAIMTYLNFPQINGCLIIYQRFISSNEQIETMKFMLRKKLKDYVDFIDLREIEE